MYHKLLPQNSVNALFKKDTKNKNICKYPPYLTYNKQQISKLFTARVLNFFFCKLKIAKNFYPGVQGTYLFRRGFSSRLRIVSCKNASTVPPRKIYTNLLNHIHILCYMLLSISTSFGSFFVV